jgi:hypothetical protein
MAEDPDELGPASLTLLLRGSEVTGGADVRGVQRRPVGSGQVASCVQLTLDLEGDAPPVTIVAKVPSDDPVSVATAAAQHLYEREVRFYTELAGTVAIRTPRCHHASFDPATGRFLLLLESLSPVADVDQLVGLGPSRAALAVEELAGLHAPHWARDGAAAAFVEGVAEELGPLYAQIVPTLFATFLERYGDVLTAPARGVVEWLAARLGSYLQGYDGPKTITHGDFRTDNLLFEGRDGEVPMATVDWQTIGRGAGALDVAYLLTTSLEPDQRRSCEDDLLARYHDRLCRLGVTGYDLDRLREDYVRHAFQGIVMLVCAAVIVERTERGDAMFVTMIERISTAVDDLDARRRLVA